MKLTSLPHYSMVTYHLQPDTKYFLQTAIERQETPVNRLPKELRLDQTKAKRIIPNASHVLVSKEKTKHGKNVFITGIKPICAKFEKYYLTHENWYLANDFEYVNGRKVISLILIYFNQEQTQMDMYYFHHHDEVCAEQRMAFAYRAIQELQFS